MLSGANLSKDYFTNRQDRYIVFKNHPRLADYMHDLMKTFKELSYGIKGRSTAIGSDNFDLVWHGGSDGPDAEPIKDPRGFTECAKKCLGSFMSRWLKTLSSSSSSSPSSATQEFDTTIQPFLQMGQFDITQETDVVVPAILEQIQQDERLRLDWTSGYFGVRKAYKEGLLQTKGPVHIVCASPEVSPLILPEQVSS